MHLCNFMVINLNNLKFINVFQLQETLKYYQHCFRNWVPRNGVLLQNKNYFTNFTPKMPECFFAIL